MTEQDRLRRLLRVALDPNRPFPNPGLLPYVLSRLDEPKRGMWRDRAISLIAILIALSIVGMFLALRSHQVLQTTPGSGPQVSAFSPSFHTATDWYGPSAPIVDIGHSGLAGSVHIRPSNAGGYVLEPVARDTSNQGMRMLSATLVHGQCSALATSTPKPLSAPDLLMPWMPTRGGGTWIWPSIHVPNSAMTAGLILTIVEGTGIIMPIGCADVPALKAASLQPRAGAKPGVANLQPTPASGIAGTLTVWPTSGGDFLLIVNANSADSDTAFRSTRPLWHLAHGACAPTGGAEAAPTIDRVYARFDYPAESPGHQVFSLILPANSRGQQLILVAFTEGTGQALSCALIPEG